MKKAVVYLRRSTNELKQANSHEMQLHSIMEFASVHNYEVLEVFAENASGTLDDRPNFKAALNFAEENDCFILAYRLDRISRSLTIFNQINPHIHRFRFSTMGNQEVSLLLISMLLSMAHAESKANSERVRQSYKTMKRNNPSLVWGRPINDEVRAMGLEVRRKNALNFNQHIVSIVNDLKAAGYTMWQIPQRLNELQVKTRRGKNFSYDNLCRIVRNTKGVSNA